MQNLKPGDLAPIRGIASSYVFGKLHQINSLDNKPKDLFNPNRIPVTQYASGTFYWMLARRRGFGHALIGHMTHNGVAVASIEVNEQYKKWKHPHL